MDASSLRCPQCGAATRSGAARCPYCRARLAEPASALKDQEARLATTRFGSAAPPLYLDTGISIGFDSLISLFRN